MGHPELRRVENTGVSPLRYAAVEMTAIGLRCGRDDESWLEGVGFAEKTDDGGDGEAHYVEEVAFDAGDPAGGVALDAVGAGFVEGVVGGEVVGEVGVGDGGEEDAGGFYVGALGGGRD